MQTNLEQVTNMIRALPIEDLDKLSQTIAEERRHKSAGENQADHQIDRYKKARKWLDEHNEEYLNKWVCLDGNRLIAADDDGHVVYKKAKKVGIKAPFIHFVEKEPEAYWGGWL